MLKNNKGFSLIEVLVTVGLIGVLVGIAVPAYNKYKESTNMVALKADLGNGGKVYTAYDAVNGTFCANWDLVGLENGGTNVFEKSQLYQRKGFIGFGGIHSDCLSVTDVKTVQHKSTDITQTDLDNDTALCSKFSGSGNPCVGATLPTDYAYGSDPAACVLGSANFLMGASSFHITGKFFQVNDQGIVSAGTDATPGDCQ